MKIACSIFLLSFVLRAEAITLDAALERTLKNNPAIQQAKLQLEEAAGRRLTLRAVALPNIGFAIPVGVQGGKRAGEGAVEPFVFTQGGFLQPIFNAAIPASYRRGAVEVLIAQQRLNIAVLEQLHAARIAFYSASYNNSLHTIGEAQRQRLAGNFKAQSDRFVAGQADRGAVTSARLLEQELRPRMEEFQRTSGGAALTLAQLMGEKLGANDSLPEVEGALGFLPMSSDLEAETTEALTHRADLKLARLLVRAAAEDQRIIEAGYYPALNGSVSGQYIPASDIRRGSEGSARRSDDIVSSEMRMGATFTWRVIDNGAVTGAVIQQRAAREINETVVRQLEAAVPRDLMRIRNNLAALRARHEALANASGAAERAVADVESNLAQGRSSQLEYRSAESSFLEMQASVLSVAFEQQLALAERDRVLGRYFQFSD